MQHPLLRSKRNLYFYLVAWGLLGGTWAAILRYAYHFPLSLALGDAGVTVGLLALLGMLCWYTVRFISLDALPVLLVVFNHLVTALVFLGLWQAAAYLLLSHLTNEAGYLIWLRASIPLRLVAGLFFYCFIALSYYLSSYYHSLQERLSREAGWNTLVKESELALLKSQLQPHFLFNSLNSLQALMLADPERAGRMLVDLAAFLRLSLNKHQEKLVPLAEELENSALYSNIEKIRFGDRLVIDSQIDEAALAVPVPPLLLQPVLENAIKHGLAQTTEAFTIGIKARLETNGLHLTVTNPHEPPAFKPPGTGIGLKHLRRRLALLYGRKDLVQIEDENGIFQLKILIPHS